ncbi:MAG: DUF3047 domain-containing protein [Deltaproteobacteria bacterium]|nr:DUF3047 domain-containing protein [Deltaproteobacteria bacterium]
MKLRVAFKGSPWIAASLLLGCMAGRVVSLHAPAPVATASAAPSQVAHQDPTFFWQERFDGPSLSWIAPFGHTAEQVASVYSLASEQGGPFLHAHHDARPERQERVRAINYGMRFESDPPALERVGKLRWRWRARQHPAVHDDPWLDLAASVYVIVRQPTLLTDGKGFKFGWLASHGPAGTSQKGLAQIELRADPADGSWRQEEVELCGLYRQLFGPCEGEHLGYVGVLTDADGTESVAEGDYADMTIDRVR